MCETGDTFLVTVMLISLAVLVASIFVYGFFSKGCIIRPISDVSPKPKEIAEGQGGLTARIANETNDEIGIRDIADSVETVTRSSDQNADNLARLEDMIGKHEVE
jgi:hypothetical protein